MDNIKPVEIPDRYVDAKPGTISNTPNDEILSLAFQLNKVIESFNALVNKPADPIKVTPADVGLQNSGVTRAPMSQNGAWTGGADVSQSLSASSIARRWADNSLSVGTPTAPDRATTLGWVRQQFGDGTGGTAGFYGTTPITKPGVNGVKAGNVALANLISQLARLGLITDATT